MSKLKDFLLKAKTAPKKNLGMGVACFVVAAGMLIYWILYLCGVVGA